MATKKNQQNQDKDIQKQNQEATKKQIKVEGADNAAEEKEMSQDETETLSNDCSEIKKENEKLQEEVNSLKDKYLRLAAEYDNYRKRTLKEKQELIKTAGQDILVNLLPVVDNFDRALETIEASEDIDAVKEGIHLIYKGFVDFLKQKGVTEIDALGKPFDAELHEAVQQVPAQSEEQKGKVIAVVQKGYMLNDKVIRHAKVVVAM